MFTWFKIKRKFRSIKLLLKKLSLVDTQTTIGKNTYIGYMCGIMKSSIGNYCSIANHVEIGGGNII